MVNVSKHVENVILKIEINFIIHVCKLSKYYASISKYSVNCVYI